jgi:hypothetical protein
MKRLRKWTRLLIIWLVSISLGLEVGLRVYAACCYVSPLPSGLVGQNDILPQNMRHELLVLTPDFDGVGDYGIHYQTNAQAYRDDPIDPVKQHVIFLGDSTTFGLNIPHADTYPEQWEHTAGPDWQAVNTAVPGMGTVSEYNALQQALELNLHPRVVVLGFFINDFTDNVRDAQNETAPSIWQALSQQSYLIRFGSQFIDNLNQLDKFQIQALSGRAYTLPLVEYWDSREGQLTRDYLSRIQALCDQQDIPFILIYIPRNPSDLQTPTTAAQFIRRWANEQHVIFIDGITLYQDYLAANHLTTVPESFYSTPGDMGHPSPLTAGLLAQAVVKEINHE